MATEYTLYGSFLSAPTYRVGLMLALTGTQFAYRHIDLSKGAHKTPEFLALNRYGQVPVLQVGDLALCQSNAILEYLAEQTGQFGGRDVAERQRIREWLYWEHDRLSPGVARTRFFTRFMKPDPAVADYMRKLGDLGLDTLDGFLAESPFLLGDRPTIADISAYAAIVHAAEGNFDLSPRGRISGWAARMAALPGFRLPYDLLPKS